MDVGSAMEMDGWIDIFSNPGQESTCIAVHPIPIPKSGSD